MMIEPQFNGITPFGDKDFTSIVAWLNFLTHGDSDVAHVGVLSAEVEHDFLEFVSKKLYKLESCDFILVTEAGELLASYIGDQLEIHASDIHRVFQRTVEDPDKYKSVVYDFLKERFDELDDEYDRREIVEIIQAVSSRFTEIVAAHPDALNELEWRDIERMLAEVFEGIGFNVELTPPSKDGGKDIILQCILSGRKHSYIVEIKHWRSSTKVGSGAIRDFLKVIVREQRDSGVFLSTYGFTSNAFEALSEIERHKIKFGEKEKIISLCRTYIDSKSGIVVSPELLPKVLFDGTI